MVSVFASFDTVKGVRDRLRELRRVVLAGHTRTGRLDQEHRLIVDTCDAAPGRTRASSR
jgi:hypothetical protein